MPAKKAAKKVAPKQRAKKDAEWLSCVDCHVTTEAVEHRDDGKARCKSCNKQASAETYAELRAQQEGEAVCADCGDPAGKDGIAMCADDKWRHPSCRRAWLKRMDLPDRPAAEIKKRLKQKGALDAVASRLAGQSGRDIEVKIALLDDDDRVIASGKSRPKQTNLAGEVLNTDDVEVEAIEKKGAKLSTGLFCITITDDDAESVRNTDPVSREFDIANRMRPRKDGTGRVARGTDWDNALAKLVDRVVEGGW